MYSRQWRDCVPCLKVTYCLPEPIGLIEIGRFGEWERSAKAAVSINRKLQGHLSQELDETVDLAVYVRSTELSFIAPL